MLLYGPEVARENILEYLAEPFHHRDGVLYRQHEELDERLARTHRAGHEACERFLVRHDEVAEPLHSLRYPAGNLLDNLAEDIKYRLEFLHDTPQSVHQTLVLLHLLHKRADDGEYDAEYSYGRILRQGLKSSLYALKPAGCELQTLCKGIGTLSERAPVGLIVSDVTLEAVRSRLGFHYLGADLLYLLLQVGAHRPDAVIAAQAVELGIQLRQLAAQRLQRALVLGHLLHVFLELMADVVHLLAESLHRLLLSRDFLRRLAFCLCGLLLRDRPLFYLFIQVLLGLLHLVYTLFTRGYLLLIVRD